jgi:hypothetical protein
MKGTFRVGDWVEIRSREEILQTLDENGELDGMLFMPEMFQFCGRRYQVHKRAHKSCDYTTPYPFRSRSIEKAVFLDTRCDGSAHGGCQASCLIFWKEAWLKPAAAAGRAANGASGTARNDPTLPTARSAMSARRPNCPRRARRLIGGTFASTSKTCGLET